MPRDPSCAARDAQIGGVGRLLLRPQLYSDRHRSCDCPLQDICSRMPSKNLRVLGNAVDATFIIALFTKSLADPHNPQHCAQCLHGCVVSLLHPHLRSQNHEILRIRHHALFDACARFITVPRSDEEIGRLEGEMSTCRCDITDGRLKAIHENGRRGSPCTYIELGLYFARVIHAALYPLWDGHKVEKIRSPQAHRSASTPWPRAPRDALPYGIDSSIAALGAWMKLHPNPIYVGLFHVLVGIFKKALVLPILRSPSLPGRFTAIAEIALDVLKQVADLYVALALIFDENETRALFSRAAEQVDEGALLRTTMSVSIEAVKLIPRFQSTASSEMRDALGQWLLKFQMAATAWHAKLNLPHDIDKYTEPIVECVREMRTMYKEPAYAAYHSFQQLNFDRCCAPGCKETFAGAQRRFAACSGCNRVTYCSKECFARAWKHPEVPHRAICRTIKYIVQATKIDRSPTVHGEKAFVCLCTVLPVDRRALEDFCAHMTKLKKYLSLVSPNDDADETREEAEPASQTGCPTEKSSP